MTLPTKKLGEIVDKGTGIAYRSKDFIDNQEKSAVPVILLRDFDHPNFTEKFLVNLDDYKNHIWVDKGDVLISKTSEVKLCIWQGGKAVLNQNAMRFRAKNGISQDFLYFALLHILEKLRTKLVSTTIPYVKEEWILNFEIPLPPLKIQKRIVARIEKLFEKIDKVKELRQKIQEETNQIFQSALYQVFDKAEKKWGTETLKKILDSVQYGISKKMNESGKGYKIFRMDNIINYHLDEKNIKYVELTKDEFLKYKLEKGDVLFNRVNSFELVGKTGIFDLEGDYTFASYLIRLKSNRNYLNPYFLNYFLNSPQSQTKLRFIARRAVQQANINAREVSSIQIPLPSLPEQKKIVAYLDNLREKVEKLKKLQETQLRDLEELKKAILEKAFKGKL